MNTDLFITAIKNGQYISIDEFNPKDGERCGCICPLCGEAVRSNVKNDVNNGFTSRFSHINKKSKCTGGYKETEIHLYAKKVIENAKRLSVPTEKYHYPRFLNYDNVKIEPSFPVEKYKQYRPDIIITSDEGERIAIEIVVTHDIDKVKLKLYQEQKFHSLRIDLSEFHKASLKEIEDIVKKKILEYDKNKKWIWPQILNEFDEPKTGLYDSKESSSTVSGGCLLYLPLIGGLIYTIYNLVDVLI